MCSTVVKVQISQRKSVGWKKKGTLMKKIKALLTSLHNA